MKKIFASLLKAIGYIMLYYLASFITVIPVAIYFLITMMPHLTVTEPEAIIPILSESFDIYLTDNLNIVNVLVMVIMLIILLIILFASKKSIRTEWYFKKLALSSTFLALLFGLTLNFIIVMLMNLLPIPEEVMNDYIEQSNVLATDGTFIQFFAICIAAPFFEEIMYRAVIFNKLREGLPVIVALILQAAFFGYMHGQIVWMAYAFIIGIVNGWFFLRYRSIWASILLHFAFNTTNYVMNLFVIKDIYISMLFLSSLIICVFLFYYEYKQKQLAVNETMNAVEVSR